MQRKNFKELKAKLVNSHQKINLMRKVKSAMVNEYEIRIIKYRKDISDLREKLVDTNVTLLETKRKKWYQFKRI